VHHRQDDSLVQNEEDTEPEVGTIMKSFSNIRGTPSSLRIVGYTYEAYIFLEPGTVVPVPGTVGVSGTAGMSGGT